jgi:hypothetical protein
VLLLSFVRLEHYWQTHLTLAAIGLACLSAWHVEITIAGMTWVDCDT